MNKQDLSAKLREVVAIARYDEAEAIELLCKVIKELNDEIEELKESRR